MQRNQKLIGYLLMFLSAFCFSLMGIISALTFNLGIRTFDLIIIQSAGQIVIIGAFYSLRRFKELRLSVTDLKIIGLQGLLASVPVLIFYYIAIQRTSASIACLLLFTNPIFITLYYIAFEKQKGSIIKIFAVITAFIGSVFVLNINPKNFLHIDGFGIAAGVISSISYAFYNIYADKKLKKYSPGAVLFYCTAVVFVFVSIINFGFYSRLSQIDYRSLKYLFLLIVIANTLPVIFLYAGIKRLGAQTASIIATGEIPLTLILSYYVLNEKMTAFQIFGSIMIIGAILSLSLLKE